MFSKVPGNIASFGLKVMYFPEIGLVTTKRQREPQVIFFIAAQIAKPMVFK